ncbi:hypothetical protein DI53_0718 [Sphingobacterium deserti]|uniref:Uncharacterized protein n=1 Tax=Sphingobacterium deserti TaxID=1229276 RepID=A0A0B8TA11_9SPHI|nr:hypothetical protein DI53_0718 [Sphingobacterium deserti]
MLLKVWIYNLYRMPDNTLTYSPFQVAPDIDFDSLP